jgi:hypothetical protein
MWSRSISAASNTKVAAEAYTVLPPTGTSSMYTDTVGLVWLPVDTPRMISSP